MANRRKTHETDPLDLRNRRRNRQRRERRIKWLLTIAALLLIVLIAVLFRHFAQNRFSSIFTAPIENPTFWYEQTEQVLFRTITPTPSLSPTATVPSPTLTPTSTATPTISPTPTLTPTPKLRPRKTLEGNAADLLALAESTMTVKHLNGENQGGISEEWFERIGSPSTFNASEIYPNADCTWMGVAGVLVDKRGEPLIGYYVQAGFPDGSFVETLSGLFPGYGESGYELTLARPVQHFESYVWIQVLDPNRLPASEKFFFRPSSDCEKSLTMINFQKTR